MRIQKSEIILNKIPEIALQNEISQYVCLVKETIQKITHPESSNLFKINPNPLKKGNGKIDKHPNGVQYMKSLFSKNLLKNAKWNAETSSTGSNLKYKNLSMKSSNQGWGPLDFSIVCNTKLEEEKGWGPLNYNLGHEFVVEWETGNVSSSHRAINKMISTMYFSRVIGGILIVPTAELKIHITDRVGNYEELEPYFPFWKIQSENNHLKHAYLEIIGITYDELDEKVEYLPKGEDGNAFRFND